MTNEYIQATFSRVASKQFHLQLIWHWNEPNCVGWGVKLY